MCRWTVVCVDCRCFLPFLFLGAARYLELSPCNTEMAEQAQQHPGPNTTTNPAEDIHKKQCGPNETKPNAIAINLRKGHNNPTHRQTQAVSSKYIQCGIYACKKELVAAKAGKAQIAHQLEDVTAVGVRVEIQNHCVTPPRTCRDMFWEALYSA